MIGFVTGLTAEARIARRLGPVLAGGGTPEGAARAARALIGQGATSLVSFGLAGGLNPALPPGTMVIPAEVVFQSRRYGADADLTRRLGGPAHCLCATAAAVVTAREKHALYLETGADAVDLESGAVAEQARLAGVPFAALRVICDPASATLPPAALVALSGEGAIVLLRVAGDVVRQPSQLPALLRLGRDAGRARAALLRHCAALKPLLA